MRSAYARAWLRHNGKALDQLGWMMIVVSAICAALADKGGSPIYLAPAVAGLLLPPLSVWLAAEAER